MGQAQTLESDNSGNGSGQSDQINQPATASNGLECSICWNQLSEAPDELTMSLSPPDPKKRKKDSTASQDKEANCCCSPCGHLFHKACIDRWLTHHHQENPNKENERNEKSAPCPICRRTIVITAVYPVYANFDTFPGTMSPAISNTDSYPIISNTQQADNNDNHSTTKKDDLLQFLKTVHESERSEEERREKRISFFIKYGEDPEALI